MSKDKDRAIVVKRSAPAKKSHHGGAWKLAYADFMTAMMAFFLLMWLLSSVTTVQMKGIADYFNQPLKITLWGGDRSAEDSSVVKGGGRDISTDKQGITRDSEGSTKRAEHTAMRADDEVMKQLQGALERREQVRLHDLQVKLMAAIEANPVLRQFKQQIRIDSTLTGLRIEIVDSLRRPMFASGSAKPESYATAILTQIGAALNDVENRVSIAGHTDAVRYPGGPTGYSNWELSSDRANAARRALVAGGLKEEKLLQVRGLADVLPLNKDVTDEPTNRRISILVLNSAAEQAFFRDGGRASVEESPAAGAVMPAALTRPSASPRPAY